MSKGGVASMLVGESKQQNKAESVVRECLSNPMLDIDYRGATGSLIQSLAVPTLPFRMRKKWQPRSRTN